ncbi:MAG: hypothetical protein K6C32_01220 [Bacilli bacterium]|nr:hypothetical protein [Bacilli bacterium]
MKAPSVTVLKKYVSSLTKIKAKYVTAERLSRVIGVYPEVINETLSYFEPMLMMDPEYNLLVLVPQIKQYISDLEDKKTSVVPVEVISKKQLEEYESVVDFVYKKMSVGGIIDRGAYLTDKDLRMIRRLAGEELKKRKNKK